MGSQLPPIFSDTWTVLAEVYVATKPTLHGCSNVKFGCWRGSYPGLAQHFQEANLDPNSNHWQEVCPLPPRPAHFGPLQAILIACELQSDPTNAIAKVSRITLSSTDLLRITQLISLYSLALSVTQASQSSRRFLQHKLALH